MKRIFHIVYSFCVSHGKQIALFAMGFFVSAILFACVLLLPSCRGFWKADVEISGKDTQITTSIDYKENNTSCDGGKNEDFKN